MTRFGRRLHTLLWMVAIASLLFASGLSPGAAQPFESPAEQDLPPGENIVHQPLITNSLGSSVRSTPGPDSVEHDGIPMVWLLAVLLILFVPAAAMSTLRHRR